MPTRPTSPSILVRLALLCTVLACGGQAQAATFRLGAQISTMVAPFGDGASVLSGGIHVALQAPLTGTLATRGVVEAEVLSGLPALRLDADLLGKGSVWFAGAGLGTGVIFDFGSNAGGVPNIVYSPLELLNAHALVGRDFGAFSLEGLVRLGLLTGVSLRASIPLP